MRRTPCSWQRALVAVLVAAATLVLCCPPFAHAHSPPSDRSARVGLASTAPVPGSARQHDTQALRGRGRGVLRLLGGHGAAARPHAKVRTSHPLDPPPSMLPAATRMPPTQAPFVAVSSTHACNTFHRVAGVLAAAHRLQPTAAFVPAAVRHLCRCADCSVNPGVGGRVLWCSQMGGPGGTNAAATQLAQDRAALVALYEAAGGPFWANHSGWGTTASPCTWFGVECSTGSPQRVAQVCVAWWVPSLVSC